MDLRTFVIYDITDDRLRSKISEACLDFGLTRIQYSAFAGSLNRNKREELFLRMRSLLGSEVGKLLVQPVCEKDASQVLVHENAVPPEDVVVTR